ncbi:hypothetical protein QFZ41_001733 [Luteibacter sp. W1I16]
MTAGPEGLLERGLMRSLTASLRAGQESLRGARLTDRDRAVSGDAREEGHARVLREQVLVTFLQ